MSKEDTQEVLHREFVAQLRMGDAIEELTQAIAQVDAALQFARHCVGREPQLEEHMVRLVQATTNTCLVTVRRIIRTSGMKEDA